MSTSLSLPSATDASSQTSKLLVAFFTRGRNATGVEMDFHAALIVCEGMSVHNKPTNIYQITNPDGSWKLDHDTIILSNISEFIGCVVLGGVGFDTESMKQMISQYTADPEQGD